jgi:uncharacterized protein
MGRQEGFMAEVRQFLYTVRPTRLQMLTEGPTTDEASAVKRHLEYLQGLAEAGVVLLAGRTQTADERTFGLVVFRAESEEAARRIVDGDPAVAHGVMKAELYPYRVAVLGKP